MNELALFAGGGGGILGGKLLGWNTVCAVEINTYAREVLLARQKDGMLPQFPIWDDIKTFDGIPWKGSIDVVSGGFPCQDISCAGKGGGLTGEHSGLWAEMSRIISEVQPLCVWVENSPMLIIRGIDRVLGDLASLGYDARWGIVSAENAGALHKRERCWILGYPSCFRGLWGEWERSVSQEEGNVYRFEVPPVTIRNSDGVACRVDRLRTIGNGQVPAVVKTAWELLTQQRTT